MRKFLKFLLFLIIILTDILFCSEIKGKYIVEKDKGIRFIDEKGNLLWQKNIPKIKHWLEVPDGNIVIISSKNEFFKGTKYEIWFEDNFRRDTMFCLERRTGDFKWVFPPSLYPLSNVIQFNNKLYIINYQYLEEHSYEDGICKGRYFIGYCIPKLENDDGLKIFFSENKAHTIKNFSQNMRILGSYFLFSDLYKSIFLGYNNFYTLDQYKTSFLLQNSLFRKKLFKKEGLISIDLEDVENHYKQLSYLDPENPYYHFFLGQAYYWQGKEKEAEIKFTNVIKEIKGLCFIEYLTLGIYFEVLYMPSWADKCYDLFLKKYFQYFPYKNSLMYFYHYSILSFIASAHFSKGSSIRAHRIYSIIKIIKTLKEARLLVFIKYYIKWLQSQGFYSQSFLEKNYYKKELKNMINDDYSFVRYFMLLSFYQASIILFIIFYSYLALKQIVISKFKSLIFLFCFLFNTFFLIMFVKEIIFEFKIFIFMILSFVFTLINLFLSKFLSKNNKRFLFLSLIVLLFFYLFYSNEELYLSANINLYRASPSIIRNIEYYENIYKKNPKIKYIKFLQGLYYHLDYDYDNAEKCYLEAKNEPDAINNLGLIYAEEGKLTEAEKLFKEAMEKGNIPAIYNLGKIRNDKNLIEKFKELEPDWFNIQEKYLDGGLMFSFLDLKKQFKIIRRS